MPFYPKNKKKIIQTKCSNIDWLCWKEENSIKSNTSSMKNVVQCMKRPLVVSNEEIGIASEWKNFPSRYKRQKYKEKIFISSNWPNWLSEMLTLIVMCSPGMFGAFHWIFSEFQISTILEFGYIPSVEGEFGLLYKLSISFRLYFFILWLFLLVFAFL